MKLFGRKTAGNHFPAATVCPDAWLFAHSSPVYVDLAGKRAFEVESARGLLRELGQAREAIRQRGQFSTPTARDKVLALYEQAEKEIAERLNQRGR